jgi:hypothetical protein
MRKRSWQSGKTFNSKEITCLKDIKGKPGNTQVICCSKMLLYWYKTLMIYWVSVFLPLSSTINRIQYSVPRLAKWDLWRTQQHWDWFFSDHFRFSLYSSKFVTCVVLFVILIVLLTVMFYVLFMCKCALPPGVNPIAVDKSIITPPMLHTHSLIHYLRHTNLLIDIGVKITLKTGRFGNLNEFSPHIKMCLRVG